MTYYVLSGTLNLLTHTPAGGERHHSRW